MRARTVKAPATGVGDELLKLVAQIGREKNINTEVLMSALEDAITTASRKAQERDTLRSATQETLISRLDRQTGEIHVTARKLVVEEVRNPAAEVSFVEARKLNEAAELGGYIDLPRSTKGLGRIEAQAAKLVISQKVREAERENIYNEYAPRVGELVNATVKRFERSDIILDLGRIEALLPRAYQSRTELFAAGDRVRAVIVEVAKQSKGPQVLVSRADPSLVVKLLEMEVPEVHEGTVTLRQTVREAGDRSKVAVSSGQRDIDAVGACVGVKGSRVQAIIRELRGEKIDIIPWAEEITDFAANALNPAKISRVVLRSGVERTLDAIVDGTQLSLAIGKKGQNVRLAARLVGCRIDIRSEEDLRREAEHQLGVLARRSSAIDEIPELSRDTAVTALAGMGILTVAQLLDLPPDQLAQTGITEGRAQFLRAAAQRWLESIEPRGESAPIDATSLSPEEPEARDYRVSVDE